MRCPACHSNCLILRTRVITDYLRDIEHRCKNDECGHIFVTQQEYVRSIVKPDVQKDKPISASA
ncbi:ogr/Delta-like zinc finger family protein [Psychrobacter sp. T6-5]|uniref:ogr/Delta-like zinc finger family protein n=1 Tax=Psychrobacter sp. T6-5 TaxID=3457451 RepID=UPI003FD1230D